MNKNYLIIIILVLLVVVSAFVFSSKQDQQMVGQVPLSDVQNETMNQDQMEEVDPIDESKTMEEGGAMEKTDDSVASDEVDDTSEVVTAGSYEAYSADKVARAVNGDVILFFHASWCPSCRALNTDIEASRSDIPSGVTILKTDYDNSTDLKQKYGVTTQHTFVQVDQDGNMIKKWSGSLTLEDFVAEIQ